MGEAEAGFVTVFPWASGWVRKGKALEERQKTGNSGGIARGGIRWDRNRLLRAGTGVVAAEPAFGAEKGAAGFVADGEADGAWNGGRGDGGLLGGSEGDRGREEKRRHQEDGVGRTL